ncbi:hypothetical protein MPH_06709 [Macrophomina phaseolina MS6]|uniref:Uncharacterized protein n=1 Tax=Macrophomina phaseolina (strain MS6) TaxID=1126212 RepID=K2SGR7_MACPH|nr:hypothetical protein MPH_06709 [Macrophomina phaseolina MS6]
MGSCKLKTGRLLSNFAFTPGLRISSRNRHAMVPEVVSEPASMISDIWSTISLLFMRTPVSGRAPSSIKCCSRSGRLSSCLVERFLTTVSIDCYTSAQLSCVDIVELFTETISAGQSNWRSSPRRRMNLLTSLVGALFNAFLGVGLSESAAEGALSHTSEVCISNEVPCGISRDRLHIQSDVVQIVHQIRDGLSFPTQYALILRDQVLDTVREVCLQIINISDRESWRNETLESSMRLRTAVAFKFSTSAPVKKNTYIPTRGNKKLRTYISPNKPGAKRSLEISAYMATLGRSTVDRICRSAALSATQTCRGPRRTTLPYALCARSTVFQIVPRAKPQRRCEVVYAAYQGPGIWESGESRARRTLKTYWRNARASSRARAAATGCAAMAGRRRRTWDAMSWRRNSGPVSEIDILAGLHDAGSWMIDCSLSAFCDG